MSTHQLPAQLFLFEAPTTSSMIGNKEIDRLNERQHSRGMPKVNLDGAEGVRTGAQPGFGGTGSLPLKPLSSPRSS